MTATASSFKTRDGFKIAYELHGNPASQKRVLMIHSLAMDAAYWRPVGERLAKQGVCAVAVSCRGHGASDKPAGPYTLELFSGDMNDLLDHLKWDKAVVAGSSMGGSVSINFALNYPKRVAGLALIDTTSCYGDDAPKAWAERANAALAKGLSSLIDFQLTRWFGDESQRLCRDLQHARQLRYAYALGRNQSANARLCGRRRLRNAARYG